MKELGRLQCMQIGSLIRHENMYMQPERSESTAESKEYNLTWVSHGTSLRALETPSGLSRVATTIKAGDLQMHFLSRGSSPGRT
jgi:hypothetical protein